jgi:LL-diaminopimelate aminotransferase
MKADRLLSLPPYLFEELENRCRQAVDEGRDVIDLSIGDPDLPPPDALRSHLKHALSSAIHHRYPPQRGRSDLKASIRRFLSRRCGVSPDDDQILILIGSKEGIAHLPLSVCNPGDTVLLPDPGYPVYGSAAGFAGCAMQRFPLNPADSFQPGSDWLHDDGWRTARLVFLNYPNNPTSGVASTSLFQRALEAAAEHGTILVNDAAYADVYFDGEPVPLLSGVPGALNHPAVEFFSFSKTYSITGGRVGFAVGHRDVIEALAHLKANIDSGVFGAIQEAAAMTLDSEGDAYAEWMRGEYEKRRDVAVSALEKLGFKCHPTCATFYVWTRVPDGTKSMEYALSMLERANVLVTPGNGFGEGGEGYFRIALTQSAARIEEAMDRIAKL